MTDARNRRESPPTEFAFDHYPKETELGVYFAGENWMTAARYRADGERMLWELPQLSYWVIAAILVSLSFPAGAYAWQFGLGTYEYVLFPVIGIIVASVVADYIRWHNRQAARLNPLLALDLARGELRIAERNEPLPTRDIVEIVTWGLTYAHMRELGLDAESNCYGQTCALLHDGGPWRLVLLYHGNNETTSRRPGDAARRLADALKVPLRTVDDVEILRDLRPRSKMSWKEITKRFGKQQA